MVTNPFEPVKLGPVTLRNRIIKAATFEGRTPKGLVTQDLIDYHLAPANGGVGLTTVAYLAVAPEGRTSAEVIVVSPESAPGLAKIATAVHQTGAKISGQLGHAGPVANGKSNGMPGLSPSSMFSPLAMQMLRSPTVGDIARIVENYRNSARILCDAGFDVLEIHLAHGYLLSSFLSPKLNRRKDQYGGSLENRARFAREVVAAVRAEVGDKMAVIAKISVSDGSPAGASQADLLNFAKLLEQDGHLDALKLSGGSSLLNPMYLFRGEVPLREFAAQMPTPLKQILKTPIGKKFFKSYPYQELYFDDYARKFRAELTMPLIQLGGVSDLASIETSLANGFEFVAMGRSLLREPNLINDYQSGAATKSKCIHCNRCMPTIYTQTRCTEI